MNWFLLLIILLMGGAGFYEYQTLNGQVTVDQMQITDLKTKLQVAGDAEKKSADNVNQLTAGLTDAQAKIADLQKQLQAATPPSPRLRSKSSRRRRLLRLHLRRRPPRQSSPPSLEPSPHSTEKPTPPANCSRSIRIAS